MKYKELLDEGIITEEEFPIKKKELLRIIIK
ncbi:SHOCT domain-containing protein [Clostridium psychrophilum]|nr:SHOCT domain-containing protein [Clostridium psychrophilum]MBU3183136.1 SHOCT domain-containing protein [Clostridium psychrophilum]